MPQIKRPGHPTIHFELDDYTDPWKNAPYMVLQHGFGRSSRFWYSWVPYLSRFYRIIRPDLRGLGQSSHDFDLQKGINLENYLGDVLAILESVGADSVHYCGESLGGIVGIPLAARYPRRVRTLSLVSTPVFNNERAKTTLMAGYPTWQQALTTLGSHGWAKAMNTSMRFPPNTDQGLLDWYAAEMGKNKVEVLIVMSQLASPIDVTGFLKDVKAPVLGLYPNSGPITSGEQEKLLKENLRSLKLVHLPTTFHTLQNIAPASCANEVLHFAAQYDGIVPREM